MKDYKDHVDISELYIFYKYENANSRIIVYASSYLEAKFAILQLYQLGNTIYNLNEYLLEKVPTDRLFNVLSIKKDDYAGYQFILSEYEYSKIEPFIINKEFSQIHHQKVLTKKFIEEHGGNPLLAPSTEEFVNNLKENTINKDLLKKQINQLFNSVGDIWYIKLLAKGLPYHKYIFGKSRLQCLNELDKELKNYYADDKPKLLINNIDSITNNEAELYNIMINYIKDNNMKKFPFTTNGK